MPTEELFSEHQYFRQIWLWALIVGVNGLIIFGVVSQVFFGETFGANPASSIELILVTSGALLLTVLFAFVRLDTAIEKDGVYYRFFPFQWHYKQISWDRISKSFVRQYNPITEYGGWGFRIGLFGKGRAFNVSGNKGLQLIYDNGKKILLGTKRPQEIVQVLKQLGRFSTNN